MYIMVSESGKHKKGIQASPRDFEEWGWIEYVFSHKNWNYNYSIGVEWDGAPREAAAHPCDRCSPLLQCRPTFHAGCLLGLLTASLPALLLQLGMQSEAAAWCLPTEKQHYTDKKMALKRHHSLFSSHELLKGGITTPTHSVIKGLQASSHTYSYIVTAICSSYSCWRTRWCLSKAKPSELSQSSISHSQMAVIKYCSFCFAFKRSSDKLFTVFSSCLHLPGPQRADPYLPCYFC